MPDHDTTPDPMDKAYAQAEAAMNDEAARAARRARVLAAVARETATPPAASGAPTRRPAWGRSGWLVAASVAGLSVLVATQIYSPTPNLLPAAPITRATQALPAPATSEVTAPSKPAAKAPPRSAKSTPRTLATPAATPRTEAQPAADIAAQPPAAPPLSAIAPALAPAAPSPAPPPPLPFARSPSPAPPPPARSSSASSVSELVVVTGQKRAAVAAKVASAPGSPADQAAKLRDAAAAGRAGDVAALLAKGVPVDAPDDNGETALMKSIRADQPKAAALLRRYGASLDTRNNAGESARDMAAAIGDAALNRALVLGERE